MRKYSLTRRLKFNDSKSCSSLCRVLSRAAKSPHTSVVAQVCNLSIQRVETGESEFKIIIVGGQPGLPDSKKKKKGLSQALPLEVRIQPGVKDALT